VQAELDQLALMPSEVVAAIVLTIFGAAAPADPALGVHDVIRELAAGPGAPNPGVLLRPVGLALRRLERAGLVDRPLLAADWRLTEPGRRALAEDSVAARLAALPRPR
jgi:hypothetical protein